MAEVAVRFQPTPNPNAGKFVVDRRLVEGPGSRSFDSAAAAAGDPLAEALFALDGVVGLFMADDFVTVLKSPAAAWSELTPRVSEAVRRVLR
jgi:hypothetical protein